MMNERRFFSLQTVVTILSVQTVAKILHSFTHEKLTAEKKESAEASVLYISVYRTSIGTELIDHGIVIPQMHRLKWINRGSFRWRIEVSSDEL